MKIHKYKHRREMQSFDNNPNAEGEEEDVDVVKVFYDDDPAALQPILASLATPKDPFARSIATQAGWNQQIKAVFQEADGEPMKVVGPFDFEEQIPINTLTNACLIGEGLAHLNLSDSKTDGSVCDVLTKATNALRQAVESAQTEFLMVTPSQKGIKKREKAEREEKASGFFLPIWALMDQMKHVDVDAGDVINLSRQYVSTEIQEAQNPIHTRILSLLNLASSNIGFHLVDRSVRRSAAFARMNPWLHTKLVRLFDRYRVVNRTPVMMKTIIKKPSIKDAIKNVIDIQRVRVEVPKNIISFQKDYINPPILNENGFVLMDGVEITLDQHDYTAKSQAKKEIKFKTGTHAAIHFRPISRSGINNDEAADLRGNTLNFLYQWPEIEDNFSLETLVVKRVKIVLYGSGNVEWWKDYYWTSEATVMPYPPRRVYIVDSQTMIEYHDIMYLIFSQSLYGYYGDLSNSIKLVQSVFTTHVSGATSGPLVMVVLESREDIPHAYPRFFANSKRIPVEKIANLGQVIRKFPRMRDVLLKKTLKPIWKIIQTKKGKSKLKKKKNEEEEEEVATQKGDPIRKGGSRGREYRVKQEAKYKALPVQIVPLTDLILKQTKSGGAIENQIRLQPHDEIDLEFTGRMSWDEAGAVGLENLNNKDQLNIPDQRLQKLANLITELDPSDDGLFLNEQLGNMTSAPVDTVSLSTILGITKEPEFTTNTESTKNAIINTITNTQANVRTTEAATVFTETVTDNTNPNSIEDSNDNSTNAEIKKNENNDDLYALVDEYGESYPDSDPRLLDDEYDELFNN